MRRKRPGWRYIIVNTILPYIIASVGVLVLYSFINWAFIIKLKVIEPQHDIVEFFVPAAITGLIVLFYLRQKLSIFKINDRAQSIILFMGWVGLMLSVGMTQNYLEAECGKLNILTNPDQIFNHEISKYYSIKKATPKKGFTGTFINEYTVNKGSEIVVACNFVCPLGDFININGSNNIWISVCFSKKYSNRLFDDKVQQKRSTQAFVDSTITKYQSYNYPISYLERQQLNESDAFINAINRTHLKYDVNKLIILTEPSRSYEDRTAGSGTFALVSFAVSNLFWILACVISYFESYHK